MFLKPDYNLKSIYDINLEELLADGTRCMLFDLDSTIMASKSGVFTQQTMDWLSDVREKFFIAIVSNNKNEKYIEKVRAQANFPMLFNAHKPDTKYVKKFLRDYNIDAKECVLVGDRPLTDILCGKLLGCKTILVDSITADSEAKIVRFVRALERVCIRR